MRYLVQHNYEDIKPILTAVDCIIFGVQDNRLKLLIFKREVEPLAGKWSLLGAFVKNDESADQAASRILFELSGLNGIYMEQLRTFSCVNRDPGGRVISIAYWSLIRVDQSEMEFNVRNHKAKWVFIDDIPDLVLDHKEMVQLAIQNLRERAKFHPVGFELIPQKFTLNQLLKVYEAIFNRPIDDRNFRKKILKSGLLTKLPEKDMSTSKKGSFLYKFNKKMYQKLSKEGYSFDL